MADTITLDNYRIHVCPHQIGFMLDNRLRRLIQNPKRILRGFINKGDTVVDMGCGPGFFTIDMAEMVGRNGKVIAADIQSHMLAKLRKKAAKHGVMDRIEFHQCESNKIRLNRKANFILAYYMIHETPDPKALLKEMSRFLYDNGKILIVEPHLHVSKRMFESLLKESEEAGLIPVDFPKRKGGRSVLLMKK